MANKATLKQVQEFFSEGTRSGNNKRVTMTELKALTAEDRNELSVLVGEELGL